MKKFPIVLLVFVSSLVLRSAHAFGPEGHSLVGAIAEARLQQTPQGQAALKRALALLADAEDPAHKGLSLMQAGPTPDDLRSWDDLVKFPGKRPGPQGGPKPIAPGGIFKKWPKVEGVPALPPSKFNKTGLVGEEWPAAIRQQMWEYFAMNCAPDEFDPGQPRHHVFHFCDIAIAPGADLAYLATKPGCGPHDIVHVIDYCTGVLADKPAPAKAPAEKVTKSIALILLVHLLGDLHQPLHVGAEYFDASGNKADPSSNPAALADFGGNLVTFPELHANLHHYWDADSVNMAVAAWQTKLKLGTPLDMSALAKALVNDPDLPKLDFPQGADTMTLAALWAGESSKLSQEAHERLVFSGFKPDPKGKVIQQVTATAAAKGYDEWAAERVQEQILRAGLRLAWLIEHALQ